MKKFISMVMAAAMVVSLVPATAFAATDVTATAKIVDALELTETEADAVEDGQEDADGNEVIYTFSDKGYDVPELQIKITNADYRQEDTTPTAEVTIKLDNAEFDVDSIRWATFFDIDQDDTTKTKPVLKNGTIEDKDEITLEFQGKFYEDDKIIINLDTLLTKTNAGAEATVSVDSDDLGVNVDDLVFASVLDSGIEVSIDDLTDVAPEEAVKLDEVLEIEPVVGGTFAAVADDDEVVLKLKLNSGFEFANNDSNRVLVVKGNDGYEYEGDDSWTVIDEDEIEITFVASELAALEEMTIENLWVEAVDAKAGDVATITVKMEGLDAVKVDVATVVEEGVTITVDEDEDVPEMWSGVNAENYGLTADEDEHESLEITFEETFLGSLSEKDEFELTLPEGVWVTGVNFSDEEGDDYVVGDLEAAFAAAYKEGDHKSFVFERRDFISDETDDKKLEFTFTLELVADPGFVGDVVLGVVSEDIEETEVTIATFKTPMIIEAEQNDLKIDYRNTVVPSDVVVKEAEAGLWDKDEFSVAFALDKDIIDFEDDLVYTANEDESGLEVDGEDETMAFTLDAESDDEAGVVTISNISLYMNRSLAAGAYDLEMTWNSAVAAFESELLFGADEDDCVEIEKYVKDEDGLVFAGHDDDKECYVADVTDYSKVVKEAWVNIVTAGREQDDASFTTKVVVPVGEMVIYAGEETIALDVPAYVSAAGYTMLAVRAVATALGINNNNVLWDQATKTVTILYGQRIITMTVGSKVINVNGSAIPASASVEIVDGRTFLPMRDLATALGVTDITWDAATKTATLNGNA
ncbi:copper amine oxidase N-terminal domain-containing protein [Anaerotignum sp.]